MRFIFDLLPVARNPIVVEAKEEDIFAPLKNAPGASRDTAEYVQSRMLAQHRRWLEASGAEVADGTMIEFSLFSVHVRKEKETLLTGRSIILMKRNSFS